VGQNEDWLEAYKQQFHDDGENGLGPTVATFSLGAPAVMTFRMKAKYWCGARQRSKNGKDDDDDHDSHHEGEEDGDAPSSKKPQTQKGLFFLPEAPLPNTPLYEARKAAWESIKDLPKKEMEARCWELPAELGIQHKRAPPVLISVYLAHGDKVIMHGEDLQKYFEVSCLTVLSLFVLMLL